MKAKFLLGLLCVVPAAANAAIPYRVEQTNMPVQNADTENDSESFARDHRFYVGGFYTFSMWNNGNDGVVDIKGKNSSSFDVVAGIRPYDTFRLEANYARTLGKWNAFEMKSDVAMINAIFDARIDSMYRMFYKQRLVPYVGVGAGISWNSVEDITVENKITPVASFMAGLGVELGQHFALDFGYRYMYMFSPKFSVINDFAPVTHQLRVGARVNF